MLYLVLAVLFLHIISVPVVVQVSADGDSDKQDGRLKVMLFFVPVYRKSTDFKSLRDMIDGTPQSLPQDKTPKKRSVFKAKLKEFAKKCAFEAVGLIDVRDIDLDMIIGAGDAAATACSVGTARILYIQTCSFFGLENDGSILPDYDGARLFLHFFGIFSISFADIIVAVCAVLLKKRRGGRRDHGNGIERV